MKRIALLALTAAAGGYVLQSQADPAAQIERTFRENCSTAACHEGAAPAMNLSLERERYRESLIGVPSEQKPSVLRVDPGNAGRSYLVMKVEGAEDMVGAQMPFGRNPLSADEIRAIRAWVDGLK